VTLPLLKCFRRILGKSEISHLGEALFHAVVAIRSQQFQRAQDAEDIEQIAANLVLPAFAAVQSQ
jgi:hypothetical protein